MNKWIIGIIIAIVVIAAVYLLTESMKKLPLRLSVAHGAHYSQLVIAVKKGFIKKYAPEVEIELSTVKSGPEKIEAMASNKLDFGLMGTPPAIIGISKDIGLKVLLSQGKTFRCLWTWREDIKSIEDIKEGDKINLVSPGTTEYVSTIKAFEKIGKTKDDVDKIMVSVEHENAYQLMEAREIDGEFASGDWNWKYEDNSAYKCILIEGDVWDMPGLVLLGREEYAEEHPEIVEALIQGYIDAEEFIKENPEEAMQVIMEFYGWDEPTSYKGIEFDYEYGLTKLSEIADVMYNLELIDKKLTNEDILFSRMGV